MLLSNFSRREENILYLDQKFQLGVNLLRNKTKKIKLKLIQAYVLEKIELSLIKTNPKILCSSNN